MDVCVVCCKLKTKGKMQDNQDKETSADEMQNRVQENERSPAGVHGCLCCVM
jgi:hypothetical protein